MEDSVSVLGRSSRERNRAIIMAGVNKMLAELDDDALASVAELTRVAVFCRPSLVRSLARELRQQYESSGPRLRLAR